MSTHLLVIGAWHHEHKKYFDKKKKQTGHLHQILTAQQKEHIYTNLSRSVVYSVSYLHFTQDVDFNENMLMHRSISSWQSSSFRWVPTWCCKHISHLMHTSSANLPRHFFVLRHHRHFYHYPQAQRKRDIPTGSPLTQKHLLQKSSNDLTVRVFW